MNSKDTPTEELRQALIKLDHQRGAKLNIGLGIFDKSPLTDEKAIAKKIASVEKWYINELIKLVDRVRVEARMEELRELMTTRWPESKNYLEKRIATLTGEEQPHE